MQYEIHVIHHHLKQQDTSHVSIMFNQQMHKVLINTYLFLITSTCFDT